MGLAYNILTPAKNLSKSFYSIKKGNAAAERVFEIIEYNKNKNDEKRTVEFKKFEKQVTFNNVEFKYGEQKILDKDSSLNIKSSDSFHASLLNLDSPSSLSLQTSANSL